VAELIEASTTPHPGTQDRRIGHLRVIDGGRQQSNRRTTDTFYESSRLR
jgi:hypothetical protein